jgi:hypothetical protein
MLGATVFESHGGFCLVATSPQFNDDTLSEDGMFDIVAHAKVCELIG